MANEDATGKNLEMDIREDGVYFILTKPRDGTKVSRAEVLSLIEEYGIEDIDFTAIGEMFKSDEAVVTKKISSNTTVKLQGEEAIIEVGPDKMNASISFIPPHPLGQTLTKADIEKAVQNSGVVFGITEGLIDTLAQSREYGRAYQLATGVAPVNGINGYNQYHVDLSKRSSIPKILEDGRADYHHLGLLELVTKNQPLATTVPATPGQDGINVLGTTIAHVPGRPAPKLPVGKNTHVSEDEKTLFASVAGRVLLTNNRITVSPVLEISGDVGNSTGDIDFNGTVIVRGNVVTDFSVNAFGDVEVYGVVEGAKITSHQNIYLFSGIQGMDKAVIKAAGNLNVKFAANCHLEAGQNIVADSILHSDVKCGGSLELTGKNGKLVGGTISVKEKIMAKVIGSSMATQTVLEVGHDPKAIDKYKELVSEFNDTKKEYDNLNKVSALLEAQRKKNELTEDKKNYLLKVIHTKMFVREKLNSIQAKINQVLPYLDNSTGSVYVYDLLLPGVKVLIGNAVMYIRDEIVSCKLTNDGSKIVIGSIT